jgi:ATP-dependent helicase/nuclease subunit B
VDLPCGHRAYQIIANMQTILGPFHPFLENALVDEILSFKQADAMNPLLLVVPSDALRRRIKMLLSRERGLALLNLQILTFSQLSLRLFTEDGFVPPELRDDLFLEEVLRQIIHRRQPGAEPFAGIEERVGGCAALWQTLRDLRDGLVKPEIALAALAEGPFGNRPSERSAQLLRLLETFAGFCHAQEIYALEDLDTVLIERLSGSRFLGQFAQIFYYGFYDLTQIQLDFFHAVAKSFPTTLFFPLWPARPGHDGWNFAERFYRRHVQGKTTGPARELTAAAMLPATFRLFDEHRDRVYAEVAQNWRCTIFNAFGLHDEVTAAAKEILRLVADLDVAFHEISVVARSLEGYGATIQEVFHHHGIPTAGTLEEPLAQFPLTKAVILLLNLPAKDFPRAQVIDLLSSPYCQANELTEQQVQARPDLWDLATRELAICKGISQWRRLRNFIGRDLQLGQLSAGDEPRAIRIPAAQLACLADLVDNLAADLLQLPQHASWSFFAGAWKGLVQKYLAISPSGSSQAAGSETEVSGAILEVLDRLAGLDAARDQVTLAEFSHTFQHWLERSTVSRDQRKVDGVLVLNAAAARGLPCRALFVLGMNEGTFPRTIREDAFLRDRDREILEHDLGYKINQKLAAFDEEKLLFNLLVNCAGERLYCSFQRADESGRALAPSWYLAELRRALGDAARTHLRDITIPRSVTDKSSVEIFARDDLLLPEELAIRLSLNGQDPTALIEASSLAPDLYKAGREAVARLDRSTQRLHELDGMVGHLAEHWRHYSRRGISPSSLETYANCPFQFFARHVLGLERLDAPEESMGPSTAEFGELGHAILKACYRQLLDAGYFQDKPGNFDIPALVYAIAQRACAEYELDHPVGYPLSWEHVKATLAQLITQTVTADLSEMAISGYVPMALEIDREAPFSGDWPEPLPNMKLHGRMDRIDRRPADNRLRVIDYKFKSGVRPASQDKDLYRSALRGQKLQPPFYYLLGKLAPGDSQTPEPEVEAKFYYIAPRWREGPLVSESFGPEGLAGQLGLEVKKTVAQLAAGIRDGSFFLQRGPACSYCEVAEICRKNHPPSLWRTENDPLTAPHRELRNKEAGKP